MHYLQLRLLGIQPTFFIYVTTARFVVFGPTFPEAYRLHRYIIMSCDLSQSYITKCTAAADISRDPNTSFINFTNFINVTICRVIHKSLRDFRTRLRNNQDKHGRKEHINR